MSDTVTYGYDELEALVQVLNEKAQWIDSSAEDLSNSVRQVLQTWSGDTATSYEGHAAELDGIIAEERVNLENLKKAVQSGVENMQQTDRAGVK